MFEVTTDERQPGKLIRYQLLSNKSVLSYRQFIDGLETDQHFRRWFSEVLAISPFDAFRWETLPLSNVTKNKPFEFVLIDAPALGNRTMDPKPFSEYFTDEPIVSFKSLGGDATLIVPSPHCDHEDYDHLAGFIRSAPEAQIDALWRLIGQTLKNRSGDVPVWLNSEGSGVAWLHVRIDTKPKYYSYEPYRNGATSS